MDFDTESAWAHEAELEELWERCRKLTEEKRLTDERFWEECRAFNTRMLAKRNDEYEQYLNYLETKHETTSDRNERF